MSDLGEEFKKSYWLIYYIFILITSQLPFVLFQASRFIYATSRVLVVTATLCLGHWSVSVYWLPRGYH